MTNTKAVLFDFGGTLFDYAILADAERETLTDLMQWFGIEAKWEDIIGNYKKSMRRVFREYIPQSFYYHKDLFRDALNGMLEEFGIEAVDEHYERYRAIQWERHARDFKLREGVNETLKELRNRGMHLGIVSNIDQDQLNHLIELSKLEPYFDSLLSSENSRSCKPDPGIFEKALRAAGCLPEEALFVGDTLIQDVAGANQAGMRSVLLWTRDDKQPPDTEPRPHHIIRRIPDLLDLV